MAAHADDLAPGDLLLNPPWSNAAANHVAHVASLGPDVVELEDAAILLTAVPTTGFERIGSDASVPCASKLAGTRHLISMKLPSLDEVVAKAALAPPLPAILGVPAETLFR